MEVKAKANYQHISPKKARLVAEAIKGMDIQDALNHLKFIQKKASYHVSKILNSALANAEHNFNMDKDNLYIKNITVNEGPTLKRQKARAMGRAMIIRKRRSHIEVILAQKVKKAIKKKTEGTVEKADIKEVKKSEIDKKKKIFKNKKNKSKSEDKISKENQNKSHPNKKIFRRKNI